MPWHEQVGTCLQHGDRLALALRSMWICLLRGEDNVSGEARRCQKASGASLYAQAGQLWPACEHFSSLARPGVLTADRSIYAKTQSALHREGGEGSGGSVGRGVRSMLFLQSAGKA